MNRRKSFQAVTLLGLAVATAVEKAGYKAKVKR